MSAQHRLPQDAQQALARGEVIEAIRRVRAATGLGLKEAKDLVDAFGRGGTTSSSSAPASTTSGPPNAHGGELLVPAAAATALQHGNVIEAIKLIRDANQLGLKQAKDAVDQLRSGASPLASLRAHPRKMPTVAPGDRGLGGWMVLFVVVVAAFAWWWLSFRSCLCRSGGSRELLLKSTRARGFRRSYKSGDRTWSATTPPTTRRPSRR